MHNHQRILRFPHRRSLGTLFFAPLSQPEEWELLSQVRGLIVNPDNHPIKWEWLEEARGRVMVPHGIKLKLKISGRGSGSLSALETLGADDLHVLDLSRSEITDVSLSHVQHLTGLRVLELTATNTTDEGLVHLQNLIKLQGLGLSHCQISGAGLTHLQKLADLRELWLSGAQLFDSELENIQTFKEVVQLGLSGTQITDDGLPKLAALKSLTRLYLFNTPVTLDGTKKLRELSPSCRVKWKPQIDTANDQSDNFDYDQLLSNLSGDVAAKLALPLDIPSFTGDVPVNEGMTEEKFWSFIDLLAWDNQGDDSAVIEPAVRTLATCPTKEIYKFADLLSEKLYLLDGEDFARNIGKDSYSNGERHFSRSYFLGARCCVIANGQEYFGEVLEEPDQMPKDLEFESLLQIPSRAFELKTGKKYSHSSTKNCETFSNKEKWTCLR
ncbi:MAG TPA: DUF4240 domain-containing protein [Oculatellaceae cyanobacterium]